MERLKQIKGAIFDLDGTILDSMDVWGDIDRKFFENRKIKMPDDYIESVNSMSFSETARYTAERFHLQDTPEELMNQWTEMSKNAYAHEIRLKSGVMEYLTQLSKAGVKLGVATTLESELFIPALKNNGIYRLFSAFTSVKEVSRGKDFPDIYLETAKRLNMKPKECAVFEDICLGIRGANAGGFLTVGVYDRFAALEEETIRREADLYIRSFIELL